VAADISLIERSYAASGVGRPRSHGKPHHEHLYHSWHVARQIDRDVGQREEVKLMLG
jgi:hypothetical protein